jgi:hypothetical protein
VIRAHQPGSEPIDIPETIPNPVVVPKPTPTPTEPAPKEPVRIPERVPGTARVACSAGRSGQSRSRWSGHGATSPRASNSLKRSLPRKNVSSICCPVTSSASRLVLLNWPPPDHLWIGTKSRHVPATSASDQRPRKHPCREICARPGTSSRRPNALFSPSRGNLAVR